MSLDVSLKLDTKVKKSGTGIFVRDNGTTRELSFEEAKEKFPDTEIIDHEVESDYVFEANITHNLNKMAMEAGIYEACWRPEEIGAVYAKDIIVVLEKGYADMKARPGHYKQFDSPNGWGLYVNFLPWVERYLNACKEYPDAIIEVSR